MNVANETTGTKVDEDTAAGKFKVSDLAGGTYQLKEKTAPNGYEVSDTVYTITIQNGTATWSPAFGADNTGNKIANTRKTGSVTWTKVSSDTNNSDPLSGSSGPSSRRRLSLGIMAWPSTPMSLRTPRLARSPTA